MKLKVSFDRCKKRHAVSGVQVSMRLAALEWNCE
jgi:hypothetical protein